MKIFVSDDGRRGICVEGETIVNSFGFNNVLCCYPYGEEGLIATEELVERPDLGYFDVFWEEIYG